MKSLIAWLRREKKDGTLYAMGGVVGVLSIVIVATFALSAIDSYILRSSSLASVISAVLVDLTNGDRRIDSLDGLTVNPVLTVAAQAKANDMAAKGYFAHVSPEGRDSWYWFKQAGYSFSYAGENLAVDFSDSVDVERAWMNSPTHRANIMNGHFTQIGIATAQGLYQGHPTTFVVQMFGTPAVAHAAQAVTATVPAEPTTPALAEATSTKNPPTHVAGATASSTPAVDVTQTSETVLGTEVASPSVEEPAPAPWWGYMVTSPKTILGSLYAILAGVILGILALVTGFEFRKHHVHHYLAATFLVLLMAGLFIVASIAFLTQPVIASGL